MSISFIKEYLKEMDKLENSYKDAKNDYKKRYDETIKKEQIEKKKIDSEKRKLEQDLNNIRQSIEKNIANEYIKKVYLKVNGILSEDLGIKNIFESDNKLLEDLKTKFETKYLEYIQYIKKVVKIKDAEIKQLETIYESYMKNLLLSYTESKRKLCDIVSEKYEESKKLCLGDYSNISSPTYRSELLKEINIGSSLVKNNGSLKEITNDSILRFPHLVNIEKNGNIAIMIDSEEDILSTELENIFTGMIMRYIESFPSGKINIGIFSSFYSSLQKLDSLFVAMKKGNMVIVDEPCTNQQKFSTLLNVVKNKANIINNKLFENNCINLHELYSKNIKTEVFQLIVIHNVLSDLTEENLRDLYGCISGLQKCGIRFVIIDDFSEIKYQNKSSSYKTTVNKILEQCNCFKFKENKIFVNEDEVDLVKVKKDVTSQKIYDFIIDYCSNSSKNKSEILTYEKIGFGELKIEKENYDSLIIPVGLNDEKIWEIEFNCVGKSPIANLVIGIPGTGKSTLIDSMIMNGAMKYSPDEIIFQLLDFKDGVSSSVYTVEECKIPHIKVVSQNNKPEEAEIILSNILLESEKRNREFKSLEKELGQTIRNISEYNKVIDKLGNRKKMPRLISVIDECQYLFEEENLAKKCEDIVRKCRSQGIHLILATQTMSRKMWNTIKFVDGRYCFEIAKDDAEQLLSRKYASIISSEVPKGSYMALASNNSGQDCDKIRIAYDCGKTNEYASKVREKWSNYETNVVIIGNKNPLYIYDMNENKLFNEENSYECIIGENYVDHENINIDIKNSRAMLLIGSNQHVPNSIFESMIKCSLRYNFNTYLIDGSNDQTLYKKYSEKIGTSLLCDNEKKYLSVLRNIMDIYEERICDIHKDYEPIIFMINSLQNINDFINNATISENIEDEDLSGLNILERHARMRESRNVSQRKLYGKESLFNLISNAYKVNIFICLSLDSLTITNEKGENIISYQQKNILRLIDYKILYENVNSNVTDIMEGSFKIKILNNLGENMAFMVDKKQAFSKFRYIQY